MCRDSFEKKNNSAIHNSLEMVVTIQIGKIFRTKICSSLVLGGRGEVCVFVGKGIKDY